MVLSGMSVEAMEKYEWIKDQKLKRLLKPARDREAKVWRELRRKNIGLARLLWKKSMVMQAKLVIDIWGS